MFSWGKQANACLSHSKQSWIHTWCLWKHLLLNLYIPWPQVGATLESTVGPWSSIRPLSSWQAPGSQSGHLNLVFHHLLQGMTENGGGNGIWKGIFHGRLSSRDHPLLSYGQSFLAGVLTGAHSSGYIPCGGSSQVLCWKVKVMAAPCHPPTVPPRVWGDPLPSAWVSSLHVLSKNHCVHSRSSNLTFFAYSTHIFCPEGPL